jgi:hypothetical protein
MVCDFSGNARNLVPNGVPSTIMGTNFSPELELLPPYRTLWKLDNRTGSYPNIQYESTLHTFHPGGCPIVDGQFTIRNALFRTLPGSLPEPSPSVSPTTQTIAH